MLPMPEVKESLVITGWKAKIANAKKNHHCKHAAEKISGIQPFVANDVVKRELTKGHLHPLPTRTVYRESFGKTLGGYRRG